MKTQDVLAVVSLTSATRDQRLHFMRAMLDREWKLAGPLRGGYFAAFPSGVDDDVIVNQSEDEISECAVLSGITNWDAVCVLNGE